jgi:hypothetical protein
MSVDVQSPLPSKKVRWAGYVVSAAPALMLIVSAIFKLMKSAEVVKGFEDIQWPADLALALGIVELGSVIIYLIPQTSVLGAILLTGYLGGAVATHVRLGEPFIGPVVLGVLVWGGLWLRDLRLRTLLPLRT